jgi:hypothetical protein
VEPSLDDLDRFMSVAGAPFRCDRCRDLRVDLMGALAEPGEQHGQLRLEITDHLAHVHGEDFRVPPEWRWYTPRFNT